MSTERDPRVVKVAEALALAYPYGFDYVKSGPSAADYHDAIVAVKALDEMEEWEYSVVHTFLLDAKDSPTPVSWTSRDQADLWLKDFEESYRETRSKGEPVYFSSRIVKRRKAGPVEDA